jgi:hypothetical protein
VGGAAALDPKPGGAPTMRSCFCAPLILAGRTLGGGRGARGKGGGAWWGQGGRGGPLPGPRAAALPLSRHSQGLHEAVPVGLGAQIRRPQGCRPQACRPQACRPQISAAPMVLMATTVPRQRPARAEARRAVGVGVVVGGGGGGAGPGNFPLLFRETPKPKTPHPSTPGLTFVHLAKRPLPKDLEQLQLVRGGGAAGDADGAAHHLDALFWGVGGGWQRGERAGGLRVWG